MKTLFTIIKAFFAILSLIGLILYLTSCTPDEEKRGTAIPEDKDFNVDRDSSGYLQIMPSGTIKRKDDK